MRKILSLALILVLALGSFATFADVDKADVANQLKDYKILIGDETGNLMLDEYLTREASLVLLARMMGEEAEAAATTLDPSFTDVNHPYYKPFIAFAEKKGWTKGIGNGLFGFGQDTTVQEFTAFMLRALSHGETPYEETMAKAKELGILNGIEDLDPTSPILRGDVAVEVFNTLNTKPANSELTLMKVLGLVDPNASKVATIEKVEANNLKQIKVYLTAPIKEAGDESNWSIKTPKGASKGTATIDKDSNFALSEDGMMVTITLTDAAQQQEKFDLTCKGLLEEKQVVENQQFLDDKIPTIESAEVIGIRTIKVMFSEPLTKETVEKTGNYKVNKGDKRIYVSRVELQANGTDALVTLSSDLQEGDLQVKVQDLKDYAKFTAPAKTFDLTVVKDTEKPTVVGYKDASPYGVTLIWSEDVKIKKDDYKYYYQTNRSNTILEKPEIKNGKELKLSFFAGRDSKKNHLLPSGTAYVYVESGAVEDYWNNKNDDVNYTIEVTRDLEAPEVEELKTKAQNKVEVKFDEEVFLNEEYDFKLLNNSGKDTDIDITVSGQKTKKLTFEFGKDLKPGNYTLVLKGIEDKAGNEMSKTNLDFYMKDKTDPVASNFKVKAYDAGSKNQKLVVMFDGEMDAESITNVENFSLTMKSSDGSYTINDKLDHDDISFEARNNGEILVIEIPSKQLDLRDYMDGKGKLHIGRLKDAAGNLMSTYSADLDIMDGDTDKVTVKAEAKSSNKIVFTFDSNVINDLKIDDNLSIYADSVKVKIGESSSELDGNKTKLTIKTEKDYSTAAGTFTFTAKENLAKNEFGVKLMPVEDGKVADKAGPELVVLKDKKQIYSSDGKLYIKMSEALGDKFEKFMVEDLVINFDGKVLKAQKQYTTAVDGDKIVVSFVDEKVYNKMIEKGRTLRVKSVKSPKYIIDLAGNVAEGFDDYFRLALTGDKVAEPTEPEKPKPEPEQPKPDADTIDAKLTSNMFGHRIEFAIPAGTDHAKVKVFINDKEVAPFFKDDVTVRASVGLDEEVKSAKVTIDGKDCMINLIKE